jgi:hypothetical protein
MSDVDRPGLLVGAELPLDGEPKLPGRRLLTVHGELKDRVENGAEHLGEDTAISLIPVKVVGTRLHGAANVRAQAKLAAHGLVGGPLGVVGVLQEQADGDVRLDVDDGVGVANRRRHMVEDEAANTSEDLCGSRTDGWSLPGVMSD